MNKHKSSYYVKIEEENIAKFKTEACIASEIQSSRQQNGILKSPFDKYPFVII